MRRSATRGVSVASVAVAVAALLLPCQAVSAAVVPITGNTAPTVDTNGYAWVSYFRGLAGLGGVTRNASLEAQEASHVRYLANYSLGCETNVHDELVVRAGGCGANRYATPAGKAAANNSNITRVSASVPDRTAVSNWFGAAFHALTLLDPRLRTTGYAAYYTARPTGAKPMAWNYTAGVDVYRGRSGSYNGAVVAFPSSGAATPLLSYQVGTESPEPFRTTLATSPCHSWGSKPVVSSPVIVQWPRAAKVPSGSGRIVDLTTGKAQQTCSLNAASYPAGSLPRQFLAGANGITQAALYYTASPFVAGHRYQVQVGTVVVTTFSTTQLPAAPNIWATPGVKSATPSWRDNSTGVTSHLFQLWSGPNCTGTLVRQARLPASQLRITVPGLVTNHLYSARVSTDRADHGSRWSGCGNFRPT